jgi:hypothetical protein
MGRGSSRASPAQVAARSKLEQFVAAQGKKKLDEGQFGNVPFGKNEFGQKVRGKFGERLRPDPSQQQAIEQSMKNIRLFNTEQMNRIERRYDRLQRTNPSKAQDYLDKNYLRAQQQLDSFRDQARLYRGTAQEPVLDQAIKSTLNRLHLIEKLSQ